MRVRVHVRVIAWEYVHLSGPCVRDCMNMYIRACTQVCVCERGSIHPCIVVTCQVTAIL